MTSENQVTSAPAFQTASASKAPEPRKLAITVIGVGGAGANAAACMTGGDFASVSFAAVNTNEDVLERCPVPRRVQIGARITRGFSAGGDPDVGRAAAEQDADKLRDLFQGAELVFVVAGLGGGTGTGAAPVVARLAKESGALVLALVTLPFEFEGSRRQLQAEDGVEALRTTADGVICLPNQKVLKMLDEKTRAVDTFKITNGLLAEGVRGIRRLLTADGLIKIDFADLARVLRGSHASSVFATAEGQGAARSRDAVEKLLASPLLEGGQSLSQADDVLVSILGGPDLTMAEINSVMEQIRRQAEQAHLVMGAAIDETLGDRLAVTVIASAGAGGGVVRLGTPGPGQREAQPEPEPEGASSQLHRHLLGPEENSRPQSRYVAPPPELSNEQMRDLLSQQRVAPSRSRRSARWRQGQLPLEIVSRGRFEKSEPTLYRGQDLDVPTYVRRGIALN
jgi:cell division protein FtsZ